MLRQMLLDQGRCRVQNTPRSQYAELFSAVPPAEQKTNKPEGPLTWSRCLVSLATCIDLANQVLADYMTSDKSKRHSQQSSVLLTALPKLLTSLLMQRDLVAGMSSILGDEQAGALREWARRLIMGG